MPISTVTAKKIQISFGTKPFLIKGIKNTDTGTWYVKDGLQTVKVRPLHTVSDPVFLNEIQSVKSDDRGIAFVLTDVTQDYRGEIRIDAVSDGIRFTAQVRGPVPLWMAEWELDSVLVREMIIPALGGQSLTEGMPAGTTLSYKYPFWWNAQFAIGSTGREGILIRTKDSKPLFKMLRVRRTDAGFALSYGFEVDRSADARQLDAVWYLDAFEGSWKRAVDLHREWLAETYKLTPGVLHPHFPDWMKNINFILEIWGIGKERPEPMHTFDGMKKRLKEFSLLHDPRNTLVYLSGWAEHGIDSRAPSYNPSVELGGDRKFKELVDYGHRLGYRVMIHTNVLAMTYAHPLYDRYKRYQVVDIFGRKQSWGLDIDGDWLTEPYFAYMNPGHKAWGDLMEKIIGEAVTKFNIDAVFLDQTLLAFNVSKGPDFNEGMKKHIRRLQHAFPDILFGGEGINDYILDTLPYVQIHGIDSVADVHGMDGTTPWRHAHPVLTYLMTPYTRFVAHLLTKHPSHPMFALQEKAYSDLGVIPALVLYNHAQPVDIPAVRKMIERAKRMFNHEVK
jgi:hypothetical protein